MTQPVSFIMGIWIVGFALAIVTGIWWPTRAWSLAAVVLIGLLAGLAAFGSARDVLPFLIASVALVIVGATGVFSPMNTVLGGMGDRLNDITRMLSIFGAPAAVVAAIRAGIAIGPEHYGAHEDEMRAK